MILTVVTPPAEAAISLAEARVYLRLGEDSDTGLVQSLIDAAQRRVETETGLALVTQRLQRRLFFTRNALVRLGRRLVPGPVQRLVTVRLVDEGAGVGGLEAYFELRDNRLCVKPGSVPSVLPAQGQLEVTVDAGFGAAADVPADLKLAILRLVADGFARRGLPGDLDAAPYGLPQDVQAILSTYRQVKL